MMNIIIHEGVRFFLACMVILLMLGCAGLKTRNENVLAVVNDEYITREDLQYSLEVEHRRQQLSSARGLDIADFIDKLIDDRLIVQEAYRLGIADDPSIRNAVQSFITRESVMKLYKDDVLQHISITEEDILQYYMKNYEKFVIEVIETGSEEEARRVLEQLESGEPFARFTEEYPPQLARNENGEIVFARQSMNPLLEQPLSSLKPGEFSGVIEIQERFLIVQLVRRVEAGEDGLKDVKGRIGGILRKQREKELSDAYLESLRSKASITIDNDILASIEKAEDSTEEKETATDERVLAEVNGRKLTVSKFLSLIPSGRREPYDKLLQNWIDTRLVDTEALNRHYNEKDPDLKNKIFRYENELIKRAFMRQVIAPGIKVSDEKLMEHYESNKKNYLKPTYYRVQQITLKTENEARDILDNIQKGAQFSWLAKRESIDPYAELGGVRGWVEERQFPEVIRSALKSLPPGDVSDVLETDSGFVLLQLIEKTETEAKDFETVKSKVFQDYAAEQFQTLSAEYLESLRGEALIEINEEAIQDLQRRIQG